MEFQRKVDKVTVDQLLFARPKRSSAWNLTTAALLSVLPLTRMWCLSSSMKQSEKDSRKVNRRDALKGLAGFAAIPLFTESASGEQGQSGVNIDRASEVIPLSDSSARAVSRSGVALFPWRCRRRGTHAFRRLQMAESGSSPRLEHRRSRSDHRRDGGGHDLGWWQHTDQDWPL